VPLVRRFLAGQDIGRGHDRAAVERDQQPPPFHHPQLGVAGEGIPRDVSDRYRGQHEPSDQHGVEPGGRGRHRHGSSPLHASLLYML